MQRKKNALLICCASPQRKATLNSEVFHDSRFAAVTQALQFKHAALRSKSATVLTRSNQINSIKVRLFFNYCLYLISHFVVSFCCAFELPGPFLKNIFESLQAVKILFFYFVIKMILKELWTPSANNAQLKGEKRRVSHSFLGDSKKGQKRWKTKIQSHILHQNPEEETVKSFGKVCFSLHTFTPLTNKYK